MGSSDINSSYFLLCNKTSNNPDSDIARLQSIDNFKEPVQYSALTFIKRLILDLLQSTGNKLAVLVNILPSFSLTPKAPTTTAEDDIHKYFFMFFRENKT